MMRAFVGAHVNEQLVEFHILLRVRVNQIVKGEAGESQHRLTVDFRIIEAVQEVNPAGSGGRETAAEFTRCTFRRRRP